jgi:hypothetical protein
MSVPKPTVFISTECTEGSEYTERGFSDLGGFSGISGSVVEGRLKHE